MDHADDGDNNNVFVYMGGDQRVPQHVTRVRVHKSVKIISMSAFRYCYRLVSVEMHDGVEGIGEEAFSYCSSLRRMKLSGVRVIERNAFTGCRALESVEFGDKLETIGEGAFQSTSLRSIKLPKVWIIGTGAFKNCDKLTDVELSEDLGRIRGMAFFRCPRLRRISIPLKANLLGGNDVVFRGCDNLSQIDLVGGIHKTISSLLLDSWRNEMRNEIDRINQDLPNTVSFDKTITIQRWMERVIRSTEHYKTEHYTLLKNAVALLELALWKAKLDEEFGEALSNKEDNESNATKKARIDTKATRHEARITSGANVVIKNVLPFLKLE